MRPVRFLPSFLALLLIACEDDSQSAAPDAAVAAPDAGAADAAGSGAPVAPVGLAVINSDRTSSSVSLVALGSSTLGRDACFHSGTRGPRLSTALSGDAALPSRPQARNELLVIDRKQSVLTWVDPATCEVQRQLNVGTDFDANPFDVIDLMNGRAYVPRYNPNPANGEGSDILIIEPGMGTAAGRVVGRIDLKAYRTAQDVLARPARGVLAEGIVYVVLNGQDEKYKSVGPGRVVGIDPKTDQVSTTIDLPLLKNCAGVDYLPAARALLVSCGGPYGDGPQQIDSSGLAWIDLSASPPAVKMVVPASGFGRPITVFTAGALGETLAFTQTDGDFMGPAKDTLWTWDAKMSAPQKLYEASGGFVLGYFVSHDHRLVYALDANDKDPRVHAFFIGDDKVSGHKHGDFKPNPSTGLPPRVMGYY